VEANDRATAARAGRTVRAAEGDDVTQYLAPPGYPGEEQDRSRPSPTTRTLTAEDVLIPEDVLDPDDMLGSAGASGSGRPPAPNRARPFHRQLARERAGLSIPRDYLAATLAALVVAGGIGIVIAWYLDTPDAAVAGLGGQLVAAGQITGFLGGYLLLVEVALMARVPWLERAVGTDWLTVAHRGVGEYLVVMLVAHALLTVLGYAGGEWAAVPDQLDAVVLKTPNVLAATVSLGLFVMIGVISARAIRRRFKYETWYFLHLYVYLAIALAFAHQLTAGTHFSGNPAVRAVWSGAHVAVLAAVLVFRVGAPLLLSYRHQLRVAAVEPEAGGAVSIYLTGRRLRHLPVEPGQFFRWRFLTRDGWWQAHPFSLSAAPNREWLRITVGALGDHTRALQKLEPGVRVLAEGPYGAFTAALRTRRKVLLLAGGIGITPLRALLEALPGSGRDVALVYRASRAQDVVFADELRWLEREGRLSVHYLFGPRDTKPEPLSAERLTDLVPDVAQRDVFLCGPPGLVKAATEGLRAAKVPRRRIHAERFDM
jgi:predicted ferric reductase